MSAEAIRVRARAAELVRKHAARLGMDEFAAAALVNTILSIAIEQDLSPPLNNGYTKAFYDLAKMMDIGARAKSPAEVWATEMRPRLEALLAPQTPAPRPSDDDLEPYLPQTIKSERRCGIQRSQWLSGWYVPWSPRNDNQNAEGPWSHWVDLAKDILAADEMAIAKLAASSVDTLSAQGGARP